MLTLIVFLICFFEASDGILTSSLPTCIGDFVEYNCSIANDALIRWNYNGSQITTVTSLISTPEQSVLKFGINFHVLFSSNNSFIMSTLRFEASAVSNNISVNCEGSSLITDPEYVEIISPEMNLSVSFKAVFIGMNRIHAMWTPHAGIIMYRLNCTLGECDVLFLPINDNQIMFDVNTSTALMICLTTENVCNIYNTTCVEVSSATTPYPEPNEDTLAPTSIKVVSSTSTVTDISSMSNFKSPTTLDFPVGSNNSLIGGILGGIVCAIAFCAVIPVIILLVWKNDVIKSWFMNSASTHRAKGRQCHIRQDINLDSGAYSTTTHSSCKQSNSSDGGFVDTYSQLQHKHVKEKETKCKRNLNPVMYAELQGSCGSTNVHMLNSTVVYSDIKGSVKEAFDADNSLDLNTVLFQLLSIKHLWKSYGKALGVPTDILSQVEDMNTDCRDKLVEVLDYWLFMHTKGVKATWIEICEALSEVGYKELAEEIMKVYTTGKLPVFVEKSVSAIDNHSSNSPPPLPPKAELDTSSSNFKDHESYEFDVTPGNMGMTADTEPPPLPPKMYM